METGSLANHKTYKHALINQINLEQCILSIRILPDGLSLFIHQGEEEKLWYAYHQEGLGEQSVLNCLSGLWREEPLLSQSFANCRVFIESLYSVWIPAAFFSPDNLEVVLNAQIPFESESQDIKSDFHFSWDAYHVYGVNKHLTEFLGKNVNCEINYLNDLNFVFNYSKQVKSIQKKVFYSESSSGVDLWMLDGSKLIFHQGFKEILSHEDIVYRIFSCLEVTDFDFVDDIFYIIGHIDPERYEKIYTYIKSIHKPDYLSEIKFARKEIKKAPEGALMYRILE